MPNPSKVTRIKGDMEQSVETALADMVWLRPSDSAMATLAVKYAQQIDRAFDDHKAIGYLGQQLHGVLRSLGGTPLERKALAAEEGGGGALAELRKARAARERGAKNLDASSS